MRFSLYISIFCLCIFKSFSQNNVIKVNYNLTKEELVGKFVESNCDQITNIKVYPEIGTDKSQVAYYSKENSDFKFKNGLVISSGYAKNTVGPCRKKEPDATYSGTDADLQEILSIDDPNLVNDVAYLQFDFVPLSDKISFNYLFASEEYREVYYACEYSDIFAFILIDKDGNKRNLAVIPNTDIPVQVTNIHPFEYINNKKEECNPQNEEYFDRLQKDGTGAIFHKGFTVPLKAESSVIPGEKYTIKLVLADYKDRIFDCAVFLEGNSFKIGPHLDSEINLCEGETTTLSPFSTSPNSASINDLFTNLKWYKDGQEIVGETGKELVVSEEGTYVLTANYAGTECTSETQGIVKVVKKPVIENELEDIWKCSSSNKVSFDLTVNENKVRGTKFTSNTYAVSYYKSITDAEEQVNKITNPKNYTIETPSQEIFVRLDTQKKKNNFTCYDIKSFTINIANKINHKTSSLNLCNQTATNLRQKEEEILANNTASNYKISYYETETDAVNHTNPIPNPEQYSNLLKNGCKSIYFRIENKKLTSCFTTNSFEVCNYMFTIDKINDMVACGENGVALFNLTSKTEEITKGEDISISYYETEADAQNNINPLDNNYTNTTPDEQTIFVRAQDNKTNCVTFQKLTLKVLATPTADISKYDQMMINVNSDASERTIESGLPDDDTYEFEWSLDGNKLPNETNNLVVEKGGEYRLIVINKKTGCKSNPSVIKVKAPIIVYDEFSPNGDGYNEYLRIENLEMYQNNTVKIYNRWGSLVFAVNGYANNSDKSFRGIANQREIFGKKLVIGVYYYIIDLGDGTKPLRGFFHINR